MLYLNEMLISDEMLNHTVQIQVKLGPDQSTTTEYYIPGEEVLAQLGYSLNCTRLAGEDTACTYTLLVPLVWVGATLLASVFALRFCVHEDH